jgi:hypothetical protein
MQVHAANRLFAPAVRGSVNSRMVYVAFSRGTHDARIFANDAATPGTVLRRDVSRKASDPTGTNPRTPSSKRQSNGPPTSTESVRDLVWICNPDFELTFPG